MSEAEEKKNLELLRGTRLIEKDVSYAVVSHKFIFNVISGQDYGKRFEVTKSYLLIGSSEACDIVLTDPTVSRKHCEIFIRDGEYIIKDLNSTNGTYLNNVRIVEAYLPVGAKITLGNSVLVFQPKMKWIKITTSSNQSFGNLIGRSYKMRQIFGILEKISPTELSILVTGETGTGKELVARAIHEHSLRKDKPFIIVDCGSIPSNLIESELFGYERGAFTGAYRSRAGAFELANGGTIFLDEIGELPLELQPKFLRAIEQKEIRRLGSNKVVNVDVRIIAATNKDLIKEVEMGNFRKDLFYRLSEVIINIPPLRERKEDIPLLVEFFLNRECKGVPPKLTERVLTYLMRQPWYGNVRELEHFIKRLLIMVKKQVIDLEDIPNEILIFERERSKEMEGSGLFSYLPIKKAREQWVAAKEKEYLIKLIRQCGGNIDQVSKIAGLHKKSIERLLRKYNINIFEIFQRE